MLAYTLFGNVVTPNNHYRYNPINQLIRNTSQPDTQYTYFANHLLATASQSTQNHHYYYNQRTHLQQGLMVYFPVLQKMCHATPLYIYNRQHSIILRIDPTHIAVNQFSPYGIALLPHKKPCNPLSYSGYQHDAFSNLYLLASRDYAPRYRTFLSRDTQDLHNRYQYGNDNPLMGRDPSGHVFEIEEAKALISQATNLHPSYFEYLGQGQEGIAFTEKTNIPHSVYKIYKRPEEAERNVMLLNSYMKAVKEKILSELPEDKNRELAHTVFNTLFWPDDAQVNTYDTRIEMRPYLPGDILKTKNNPMAIARGQQVLLETQGRLVGDPSGNFITIYPEDMQFYFGQTFPFAFDLGRSFQVIDTPENISTEDVKAYIKQFTIRGIHDLKILGFEQYSANIEEALRIHYPCLTSSNTN